MAKIIGSEFTKEFIGVDEKPEANVVAVLPIGAKEKKSAEITIQTKAHLSERMDDLERQTVLYQLDVKDNPPKKDFAMELEKRRDKIVGSIMGNKASIIGIPAVMNTKGDNDYGVKLLADLVGKMTDVIEFYPREGKKEGGAFNKERGDKTLALMGRLNKGWETIEKLQIEVDDPKRNSAIVYEGMRLMRKELDLFRKNIQGEGNTRLEDRLDNPLDENFNNLDKIGVAWQELENNWKVDSKIKSF